MLTLATINAVAPAVKAATPVPQMDVLMVAGFLTSVLTLLLWMHLGKSRACTLAFAMSLSALAIFAFLQGAWPLGMVIVVWSVASIGRWRQGKDIFPAANDKPRDRITFPNGPWAEVSRVSRIFEWN